MVGYLINLWKICLLKGKTCNFPCFREAWAKIMQSVRREKGDQSAEMPSALLRSKFASIFISRPTFVAYSRRCYKSVLITCCRRRFVDRGAATE